MGRLTTLIVGGLVGAGLALAYAPRSGAETREKVAQKVNQVWEEAQGVAPVLLSSLSVSIRRCRLLP